MGFILLVMLFGMAIAMLESPSIRNSISTALGEFYFQLQKDWYCLIENDSGKVVKAKITEESQNRYHLLYRDGTHEWVRKDRGDIMEVSSKPISVIERQQEERLETVKSQAYEESMNGNVSPEP